LDQERREMIIQDQRGAIELTLQRGERKGYQEGYQEGFQEGLAEVRKERERAKRRQIAASLLGIVEDNRLLAEKTELSEQEIAQLRSERHDLGEQNS
jgi:flagellar biosynthesis/type III secretory pathway protein FliH